MIKIVLCPYCGEFLVFENESVAYKMCGAEIDIDDI